MLKWLAGCGVAGPAPVIRRAREVVAALPPDNAVVAVKDITAALENLNNADSMALAERYAEIEILDGVAVSYTHMLLTEYLDTPRQKKQRETRLWDGAYGYWSELATAYVRCVQRYAEDPENAEDFRDKVTVALARRRTCGKPAARGAIKPPECLKLACPWIPA